MSLCLETCIVFHWGLSLTLLIIHNTWYKRANFDSPHLRSWQKENKSRKNLHHRTVISSIAEKSQGWLKAQQELHSTRFFLPLMSLKNVRLHNNYTEYVVNGKKRLTEGQNNHRWFFPHIEKQMHVEISIASDFLSSIEDILKVKTFSSNFCLIYPNTKIFLTLLSSCLNIYNSNILGFDDIHDKQNCKSSCYIFTLTKKPTVWTQPQSLSGPAMWTMSTLYLSRLWIELTKEA